MTKLVKKDDQLNYKYDIHIQKHQILTFFSIYSSFMY